MYDNIMFIDFDGTITSEETLSAAMKMCVPTELFRDGTEKMKRGEWTLKDAVYSAFENIPSSCLADILAYVKTVPIRPGFSDLLQHMAELDIPVVVISGGLKPYVDEKLKPFAKKLLAVHSLETDISGDTIKLISPYVGETDVLEKTKIMKHYDYRKAMCVGDGLTDVKMAMACDRVFARDMLAKVLTKKNIPFVPWDTFYDISNEI